MQYGKDTTGGIDTVDKWTQTVVVPPDPCDLVRIRAVRLAVVARSEQFEKTDAVLYPPGGFVTAAAPLWDGSTATAVAGNNPIAAPVDLTGNLLWQNYRYKLFETVAPIRNTTYAGINASCPNLP